MLSLQNGSNPSCAHQRIRSRKQPDSKWDWRVSTHTKDSSALNCTAKAQVSYELAESWGYDSVWGELRPEHAWRCRGVAKRLRREIKHNPRLAETCHSEYCTEESLDLETKHVRCISAFTGTLIDLTHGLCQVRLLLLRAHGSIPASSTHLHSHSELCKVHA